MRSAVMRCLAAVVLSMCLLATAHAQQVPLESRPKLRELQEREQALLNARRVLTELLNDRADVIMTVSVAERRGADPVVLPVGVSRTNLFTTIVMETMLEKEKKPIYTVEQMVGHFLRQDRALRQQIQQSTIPDIDTKLAETRGEVDRLLAPAERPGARAQSTAESGSATKNVPMKKGHRVDVCLVWSGQCGKPAADRWCVDNQLGQSLKFSIETIDLKTESSITLGSGDVCSAAHHPASGCGAFTSITCAGK